MKTGHVGSPIVCATRLIILRGQSLISRNVCLLFDLCDSDLGTVGLKKESRALIIHLLGCIIERMKLIVNYWRNPSGKAPVERYLDAIDDKEERAEILATLKGIQQYGTDAVGVEFRRIEGKLW